MNGTHVPRPRFTTPTGGCDGAVGLAISHTPCLDLVSQLGILASMSVTTIKVDSTVRDRLASVARARGTTMGALLADLAQRVEDEQRWTEIEAAYHRLRTQDPEGWREYLAELAEWDIAGAEPDPAAAEEWPDYNQ
jgi:hypothetical protein